MSTEALVCRSEWRDIYGRVGRAGEPAGVGAAPGGPGQADEHGAHPAVAASCVAADGRRVGHKHSHSAFAGVPLIYTPCHDTLLLSLLQHSFASFFTLAS